MTRDAARRQAKKCAAALIRAHLEVFGWVDDPGEQVDLLDGLTERDVGLLRRELDALATKLER